MVKSWPVVLVALAAVVCLAGFLQYNRRSVKLLRLGGRVYDAQCAICHGPGGSGIVDVDLAAGRYKSVVTAEDLSKVITAGIPGAMPPANLAPPELSALLAHLNSWTRTATHPASQGNVARGKELFEGKGGCVACHRIGERGSRLGPDLTGIGALRPAASIEQSILYPDAAVAPEYLFCRATTRAGQTITGRRLNEDLASVQLLDSGERLVSLDRSDLREFVLMPSSPMPSYRDKLTSGEIVDLVAFLSAARPAVP